MPCSYNLEKILSKRDVVLVDTNILNAPRFEWEDNFARELFKVNYTYQLEYFLDRIDEVKAYLNQQLDEVVRRNNVYTIPEVLGELDQLEQHLDSVCLHHLKLKNREYHGHCFKKKVRLKSSESFLSKYNSGDRRNDFKSINKTLEKDRSFAKKYKINLAEETPGLAALKELLNIVRTIKREVKLILGPREPISVNVEGASTTDYALVSIGIGYSLEHPNEKVAIVTADEDLMRIYKKYLRTIMLEKNEYLRQRLFVYDYLEERMQKIKERGKGVSLVSVLTS
jgi:hypothetical protein